jgi:hypothetical protein
MESLLPYTEAEKGRETCHSSKALCWQARRRCSESRELLDKATRLLRRSHQAVATTEEKAWHWSFVRFQLLLSHYL